jgi:hypothetical protein
MGSFRVTEMTRKRSTRSAISIPSLRVPVFVALLLGFGAAFARAQTCNASNDPTIAIVRTADLQFGQLIATASAGTAVIDAATGTRAVTGGVVAAGGVFNTGDFSVLLCGSAGPKRFDVLLPSGAVTITGPGGNTMTVDTWTVDPGPNNVVGSTSIARTISVGGTLHVGANQAAGLYSGTYSVTVTRQ